ncbi:GL12627 [Drosophila persimilis]|uniref:GL12627 n=1 Tax=Drosophila persimilis TaxID=7234 RepID=B4GLS1_DROPE|nr:uncharacterized protein LOC6594062 [Drosophila persimilis]EDW38495.1 GL12627 [Drosophila persimilis]
MGDSPPGPQTIGRPEFYKKVYTILVIFIVTGLLQLVIVKACDYDFYSGFPVSSTVWVLIALWCLLTLLCVPVTHAFPITYVLGIIAAEALTLSVLSQDFLLLTMAWTYSILAVAVILSICLYVIGIFMPLKFLPGSPTMLGLGIAAIIVLASLLITRIATGNEAMMFYFNIVSLLYFMLIVVFTITVVHDRRLQPLPQEKRMVPVIVLAALFFYMIRMIAVLVLYAVRDLSIKSAINPGKLQKSFFQKRYIPEI